MPHRGSTTVARGMLSIVCCVACLAPTASAEQRDVERWQLVRVEVTEERQLVILRTLDGMRDGLEIWTDRPGIGPVDVRVSATHKQKLLEHGLDHRVVVADLGRQREDLFSAAADSFFDGYRTYDEHVAFMAGLVAAYPQLAQIVNLGSSVEGRDLLAIRITGGTGQKPAVFFHGAQHGNEITNPAVLAFTAEQLLTQYGTAPVVTSLVDDLEWFLLPITNPDGYVANTRHNANGFDLNRNWGGPGSTADFSQPETAALRDFFALHPNIVAHIDFHTYGYMILWPWGHTDEFCLDHLTFERLGNGMAERILDVRGVDYYKRGPMNTTIYPVRGGSVDYVYGELAIGSWVFEVGGSYAVPTYQIVPTARDLVPAMLYVAAWASDCDDDELTNAEEFAAGAEDCNDNGIPDHCESNIDDDIYIDSCDWDTDDDGVPTESDECPFGPVDSPATSLGAPISDTNGNCKVDLADYGLFGGFPECTMSSGPGVYSSSRTCRALFDYDGDDDIDLVDFSGFQNVFGGD